MHRLSASLLSLLLLPVMAAAQQKVDLLLSNPDSASTVGGNDANGWVVPVWRAPDGRLLALIGAERPAQFSLFDLPAQSVAMHDLLIQDGSHVATAGVSYNLSPKVYTSLSFNTLRSASLSRGCTVPVTSGAGSCTPDQHGWRGGSFVGGFRTDAVFVDIGLNWLQHDPAASGLLLIMPDAGNGSLLGIPSQWIDSLTGVDAQGSLRLGDTGTRLNMGASIGRIRLLSGRVQLRRDGVRLFSGFEPGVDAIDQKVFSLGLGKGSVTGTVVGRLMQPVGGDNLSGQNHQWSAVDLGITIRLPWEGELSLGAQNLWSSGGSNPNLANKDADPTQNRIPYIQYHQEL